ncbi:hypothetical protein L1887_52121 [Cichorium endivia]|nr:hypothetical protein L1887_52121 [Cichorium endivia]
MRWPRKNAAGSHFWHEDDARYAATTIQCTVTACAVDTFRGRHRITLRVDGEQGAQKQRRRAVARTEWRCNLATLVPMLASARSMPGCVASASGSGPEGNATTMTSADS